MHSRQTWYRLALHELQTSFWMVARWALLLWGVLNGLGIGMLGRVERVKHRISRRVPRVSTPSL